MKVCKKHDFEYKTIRCKFCKSEYNKIWHSRPENKEKIKRYEKTYRDKNREKRNAASTIYYHANKDYYKKIHAENYKRDRKRILQRGIEWRLANPNWQKEKAYHLEKDYKDRRKVKDAYMVQQLRQMTKLDCVFPVEMIEAKRVQLQLLRLIKELQHENAG